MKKQRITLIGTALTALLILFSGCGENSGNKATRKALKAWEKGKLVAARTQFEKATKKLSNKEKKAETYNNLGLVLWELNEQKEAAEAFNNACETAGIVNGSTFNLAMAQYRTGDLANAEITINQFISKNPTNQAALKLLGAISISRLNKGELPAEQAAQALRKTIAANPDHAPTLINLAELNDLRLDEKAKAYIFYQAYLAQPNTNDEKLKRANNAIDRLSAEINERSNSTNYQRRKVYYGKGEAYFDLGDYERALYFISESLKLIRQSDAYALRAKIYGKQQAWDKAMNDIEMVRFEFPERADALAAEINAARGQ